MVLRVDAIVVGNVQLVLSIAFITDVVINLSESDPVPILILFIIFVFTNGQFSRGYCPAAPLYVIQPILLVTGVTTGGATGEITHEFLSKLAIISQVCDCGEYPNGKTRSTEPLAVKVFG